MRKLGKQQLILQLQSPLDAHAAARSPSCALELSADGTQLVYTFDARGEQHRRSRRCCRELGEHGIEFKDLQTQRELARGHLRQPGEGQTRMNRPRDPRDLPVRDGAHVPHAPQSIVSPVLSTSLYFVVFGSAIGSRMGDDRRRQLRRVHRAGPR